jgi:hypothetical protein
MERLSAAIEQAKFWRVSAGELRQLAEQPVSENAKPERLLKLAAEYERIADNLVTDWAHV